MRRASFRKMRWLPFDRSRTKPVASNAFSASAAVQRGSLGIDFNGRRQNLLTQEHVALVRRQRLQVEFNGLADVGQGLFKAGALRLAALQFRAPGVIAVLVFF